MSIVKIIFMNVIYLIGTLMASAGGSIMATNSSYAFDIPVFLMCFGISSIVYSCAWLFSAGMEY